LFDLAFVVFDSNTQTELEDSSICMGVRKQIICIKFCQNSRPQQPTRMERIPSRIMALVCSVSENICWDTDSSAR